VTPARQSAPFIASSVCKFQFAESTKGYRSAGPPDGLTRQPGQVLPAGSTSAPAATLLRLSCTNYKQRSSATRSINALAAEHTLQPAAIELARLTAPKCWPLKFLTADLKNEFDAQLLSGPTHDVLATPRQCRRQTPYLATAAKIHTGSNGIQPICRRVAIV